MERYTKRQVSLLVTLFIAYTAAYISRTNLSPALDAIQSDFGLTAAQVGLLPTFFAIPYALGQVVNGTLADHFRPRNFITIGLVGSALMNILFSLAPSYPLLIVLWCLNGCFQSMIWTPIVRIMATEYQDSIRPRAMFTVSMTLIVGYLVAWAISGFLTSTISWRWAFRTSGLVTGVLGVGCFFMLGNTQKAAASEKVAAVVEEPVSRVSALKLVFGTDLFMLLLGCVFNGYVRDSIMNWAPKMLVDTQGIDLSSALGVVLIIPIINFLGIQFGKVMFRKLNQKIRKTCAWLLGICAVVSLILTIGYQVSPLLCTVLLGLCSAMSYGINPLLTSFLPMDYHSLGRVGMAAGLIDALIYVGSAFSGTFAGMIYDHYGWSAVFASWTIFSVIGVATVLLALKKKWTVGVKPVE